MPARGTAPGFATTPPPGFRLQHGPPRFRVSQKLHPLFQNRPPHPRPVGMHLAFVAALTYHPLIASAVPSEPGKDAFHRVPFISGEIRDAVERVLTVLGGRLRGRRPAEAPRFASDGGGITLHASRSACVRLRVHYRGHRSRAVRRAGVHSARRKHRHS